MTSKRSLCRQKHVMASTNLDIKHLDIKLILAPTLHFYDMYSPSYQNKSWRQKYAMTTNKVCHDIKNFHNVEKTVMTSNARHDVKTCRKHTMVMTSKVRHNVQKYALT